MPIKVPPNPSSAKLSLDGDVQVDAFGFLTRIVSVPTGVLFPIPDQRVLGNDSGALASPIAITVHQELDWIGGGSSQWVFDGVDDRVDFGDVDGFERTSPFTLSIWFQRTVFGTGAVFLSKSATTTDQRGFLIGQNSDNTLAWRLNNNIAAGGTSTIVVNSTAAFPDSNVHHFAVTYAGTSASSGVVFYLDGVAIGMTVVGAGSLTATAITTSHLCIGAKQDGTTAPFAGRLFHGAIWSSVLTAGQIAEVYNAGVPPVLTSLPTAPGPLFWAILDDTDTAAAGGVIDHGSGAHNGSAAGGINPSTQVGALPVRGTSVWQLLSPGAVGSYLTSNGPSSIPVYTLPNDVTATTTGTQNALAFPAGFRNRDTLDLTLSGNTTLNGVDATGIPPGFEFVLRVGTSGGFLLTMQDENASATATNRLNLPNNVNLILGEDCGVYVRRALTRWLIVDQGWPTGSTSVVYNSRSLERAAITGAVTAAQNSNTTAFGTAAAKSVLANATNATAVPAYLAGSAAFQHLRVNSANTGLEWSILQLAEFPTIAAGSFLANITAGVAVPTAVDLTTFAGGGLTYTNVSGIMAVGAGTGLTVNANDVQISAITADSFFMNNTSGSAVPVAVAGTTVAGAGLTYTTGGVIAVVAGAGASLVTSANDIQRGALTGAITAAQDSNTTAFGVLAAKSVLANATNASAIPAALAGSGAFQYLRVNLANTGLEWAVLDLASFPTIANDTFLANVSGGTAAPAAKTFTSLAGSGLTWDATGKKLKGVFPGSPVYDVRDFGAIGDGTTDDTAALNAAIAAANATPGAIYLMGAHRVTASLTTVTGNNIAIIGRGEFNGGSRIVVDSVSAIDVLIFSGCQYPVLEQVWFTSLRVYTSGWAVKFIGCFKPRADRVVISELCFGIINQNCTLSSISRCNITNHWGVFSFFAEGTGSGNFNHAISYRDCVVGTNYPLTLAGTGSSWAISTAYIVGQVVLANGALYQCAVAGTSASSGTGPSGIPSSVPSTAHTTQIVDGAGALRWVFAMPAYAGFLQSSFAQTFEIIDCGVLQGLYGFSSEDPAATTGSAPIFARTRNLQVDHTFGRGIRLAAGSASRFEQTFITSILEGSGIEIESGYTGNWDFIGGEIFGCNRAGMIISKGNGVLADFMIGACGGVSSNTRDCIEVGNSSQHFTIQGCSTGTMIGGTSPATRYGISVAAGCDNYIIEGNRAIGNVTGSILNTPGTASTRVVRNNIPNTGSDVPDADYGDIVVSGTGTVWTIDNSVVTNAKLANMAVGTQKGRKIDAGSTGVPVDLTGAEQGQNLRYDTRQTVAASGTMDITLNDNTTILVLQLSADTTVRSISNTATGDGRPIRIEHDTGAFTLTLGHNLASPTFFPFFNPNTVDMQLRLGATVTVRSRSGFWRPEYPGTRMRALKNSAGTVFDRGRLNLIEGSGITLTVADDPTNDEIDVTVASSGSGHVIRDDNSNMTQRAALNFVSSTTIDAACTDDAANGETEVTFTLINATVTPTKLAVFGTPTNAGSTFCIYVAFSAGAGGSPDDVTIYSSAAPFNFRILEAWLVTATAVAASTVIARTATGGLGSTLTTAISATATGKTSDNSTATTTVASGGTVVLRRSDSAIAGEFIIMAVRT